MSRLQTSFAILVPLLWGLQFVLIKVGLSAFPPLFFVGLRFSVVAAILLPFVDRPTRHEIAPMLAISVLFGGLNFGLMFIGVGEGHAGVSAVANQVSIPFAILLAWPFLGERPSCSVVLGVILAFAGVAMTAMQPLDAPSNALPIVKVVCAGLAWAAGSVLTRRFGPFQSMKLVAWMSLFTVPQVLAASLLTERGQYTSVMTAGSAAWLAFGYTVVFGAVVGWGLWFWLLARCSTAQLTPFALLQVVFAVMAGHVFLNEPLTWELVAGAGICVVGVAMTQIQSHGPYRLSTAAPAAHT